MTRIKSNNVQLGGDFFVPIEEKVRSVEISQAYSKEKAILLDAEKKAEEILAQAQAQAQQTIDNAISQAQEEIGKLAEQARQDGFAVGKKQGNEAIVKELSDKILAVNDFAQGCFEVKNAIVKSAHMDMVNLITQIAHKVCSTSLKLDKNVLEEITAKAIHSLKDKESINIIINPDMAERIYAISDELKAKIPQLKSIKIIEDCNVSPDGAIVESPLSRVDSRISAQISAISEKLMMEINSTDAEELMPHQDEMNVETQIQKNDTDNNIPKTLVEETIEASENIEQIAEITSEIIDINTQDIIQEIPDTENIDTLNLDVETIDTDVFTELDIPNVDENPDESN